MEVAVPKATAEVQIANARYDDFMVQVSSISDHFRLGHLTRTQACYLHILNVGGSGSALIGGAGTEGLLMAKGHLCSGNNHTPAAGELFSEMMFEGQPAQVHPWRIPQPSNSQNPLPIYTTHVICSLPFQHCNSLIPTCSIIT
ncbi:hypothetical protein HOY80DRAFT_992917 [Tuber brumale]|nr:hypothetical protein HOY80DRAFT_992917 [Tuber brumale]